MYIRVSTDEQANGNSLPYQEERLRKYCEVNNIEVVALYSDDHSAKTFDRPAFKKLLSHIKKNRNDVDLLLFLKWDWFSRAIAGNPDLPLPFHYHISKLSHHHILLPIAFHYHIITSSNYHILPPFSFPAPFFHSHYGSSRAAAPGS